MKKSDKILLTLLSGVVLIAASLPWLMDPSPAFEKSEEQNKNSYRPSAGRINSYSSYESQRGKESGSSSTIKRGGFGSLGHSSIGG